MDYSNQNINDYLYYGYLPPKKFPEWLYCNLETDTTFNYSPIHAANKFDTLFDKLVSSFENYLHIIPLSGGWDSRAIFAALLDRVPTHKIRTVSYGTPGQLDFEIGRQVASKAGSIHTSLNLEALPFTWDILIKTVKNYPWTYVPDCYFNHFAREMLATPNSIIWSGFLGDPIAGSHVFLNKNDYLLSKNIFIKKQRRFQGMSFESVPFSPSFPFMKKNNQSLWYDDLMDLGIRQTYCIAPIVLPVTHWQEWGASVYSHRNTYYLAPFADKEWATYWLNAPRIHRFNQSLYIRMLKYRYPSLFSLPGKKTYGIDERLIPIIILAKSYSRLTNIIKHQVPWLHFKSPATNYVDYSELFRKRSDYKKTLEQSIRFLKSNKVVPWLNLDLLVENHFNKKSDNSKMFLLLIGLSVNLHTNN